MITQEQIGHLIGTTAYGSDGDKIGKVGHIYLDEQTGQPEWLTVHTGWFGTKESFVPLQRAELGGGDTVVLPYDKAMVKEAPKIDPEGGLSEQEETELYHYYGLDYSQAAEPAAAAGQPAAAPGEPGFDRGQGQEMTRAEERLRVGTEQREVGRVRLRKYVVTENVQVTVPVSHEEAHIVREPVSGREQGTQRPQIAEEEREVTLHAERPVVSKETEAVERVRIEPEAVVEQETVSGQVRKEQIEAEGLTDRNQRGR
jgi:uncharacterized protein (TIGR02271 family)